MTPEEDALSRVVAALEARGIRYMVTGSVASSHHGRPRMTQDVDVVIDPEPAALARLVEELQVGGFYVDAGVAEHALRTRRQFNVIEGSSAAKIDLIICKNRPFSRLELSRGARTEIVPGLRAALATPEDTILSKLEWARKAGGSERQLADVAGVLEVSGAGLDRDYVERWASELGVLDLWRALDRARQP